MCILLIIVECRLFCLLICITNICHMDIASPRNTILKKTHTNFIAISLAFLHWCFACFFFLVLLCIGRSICHNLPKTTLYSTKWTLVNLFVQLEKWALLVRLALLCFLRFFSARRSFQLNHNRAFAIDIGLQ